MLRPLGKRALRLTTRFRAFLQGQYHCIEAASYESTEQQYHQRCEDARKCIGCRVAVARTTQRLQVLLATTPPSGTGELPPASVDYQVLSFETVSMEEADICDLGADPGNVAKRIEVRLCWRWPRRLWHWG